MPTGAEAITLETSTPETLLDFHLTPNDQVWLSTYGLDSSWQNDPKLVNSLNEVILIGSRRLDEPINQTPAARAEIMYAREQLMDFLAIAPDTLDSFRKENPTIIPLDTFLGSQRIMPQLGLDAAKIINALPAAIGLAPESVRAKFDNLSSLGLDAAKIINALPAAIGYAPESVQAKFDNLSSLGLDAAKIINALPAAISYAPESVQAKFELLSRSAEILSWDYTAQELVETYPAILSFNKQKLLVLRRIAAHHSHNSYKSANPQLVRSALITPLENYIISLSQNGNQFTPPETINDLAKQAKRLRLSAEQRRAQALNAAPRLGKTGTAYLKYRR